MLSRVVVVLLLLCAVSDAHSARDSPIQLLLDLVQRFVPTRGLLATPAQESRAPAAAAAAPDRRRWIETVSWSPRAYIFHNFLTHAEADHIVELVEGSLVRSNVINTTTGAEMQDSIRTSYGGHIGLAQTPMIAAIEQRIAEWTHLPAENGEPLQVLRYQNGQEYGAHWDWFDHPAARADDPAADNRVATVLMYLGVVEEGGETTLPLAEPIDAARQDVANLSACASKGGIAVRPVKGDALLFWDMKPDGRTVCRASLHASCPTTKGTKYTSTKWIHKRSLSPGYNPLVMAARCEDVSEDCPRLAQEGRCDSEAAVMLGLGGRCRVSCQDCISCEPADVMCLRRNARSQRSHHLQQQKQQGQQQQQQQQQEEGEQPLADQSQQDQQQRHQEQEL